MSRHVTIHSDGTGHGTVLLDADGNKLDNVSAVDISIEANGLAVATLTINKVETIVSGDVESVNTICPMCSGFIQHTCDPEFKGTTQTAQGTVTTASFFDFEICGKTTASAAGSHMCYMNKALFHSSHIDLKTGTTWSAI